MNDQDRNEQRTEIQRKQTQIDTLKAKKQNVLQRKREIYRTILLEMYYYQSKIEALEKEIKQSERRTNPQD